MTDSEEDNSGSGGGGGGRPSSPEDFAEEIRIIDSPVEIIDESWDDIPPNNNNNNNDINSTLKTEQPVTYDADVESWEDTSIIKESKIAEISIAENKLNELLNDDLNEEHINKIIKEHYEEEEEGQKWTSKNKNKKESKFKEMQGLCETMLSNQTRFPRIEIIEKIYFDRTPTAGPSNKPPSALTQGEEEAKYVTDCVLWNCLNKIDVGGGRFQFGINRRIDKAKEDDDEKEKMEEGEVEKNEKEITQLELEQHQILLEHLIDNALDRANDDNRGDNTKNNVRYEADSGPLELNPICSQEEEEPEASTSTQQGGNNKKDSNLLNKLLGNIDTASEIERSSLEALGTNSHVDLLETIDESSTDEEF